MFRSSPSEVFSNKDTVQIRSEPTGEQTRRSAIPTKPLRNFIEITPMHGAPRKSTSHPQNTSPQENTSGRLPLYVKIVLKDLDYKKLLFTTVERNLLTLKNKWINK